MEIKKVIKTDEGTLVFSGEISEEEHDFILSVGLNTLIQEGAIAMQQGEDDDFDVPEGSSVQ